LHSGGFHWILVIPAGMCRASKSTVMFLSFHPAISLVAQGNVICTSHIICPFKLQNKQFKEAHEQMKW
jgi:hypothetical protein